MSGGTITSNSNAVNAYRGAFNIFGGTVESTSANSSTIAMYKQANCELTIGSEGGENGEINIRSLSVIKDSSHPLRFLSGTIGTIKGAITSSDVVKGLVKNDFSDTLASGLVCQPYVYSDGNTYYKVVELTEETAGARVSRLDGESVLYASAVVAARDLAAGETLVLLKDVEGESSGALLSVSVRNAVVDLNGFDVRNTSSSSGAKGIEIAVSNASDGDSTFDGTVKNSKAEDSSTVTATTPLGFSAGNSNRTLTVKIEGKISLGSTASTNQGVELGTGARLAYSEDAAAAYGNGGFKADTADGPFIYGSAGSALKADVDNVIELLNNYVGPDRITFGSSSGVLDMQGHSFTTTSVTGVIVNHLGGNCTVKNGTVTTTAPYPSPEADGLVNPNMIPAALSVFDATAQQSGDVRTKVTLEGVKLVVENGGEGVITHGTNKNIDLALVGCTIQVNADPGIGVYFPSADSTLTVDDTDITAGTGIAIKGGEAVIKGGSVITATGEAADPSAPDTSGVNETGDAVYVEGNYANTRDVKVTIEDAVLSSENGKSVNKLFDDTTPGQGAYDVTIVANGGTYDDTSMAAYIPASKAVASVKGAYTIYPDVETALQNGGGYSVVDANNVAWIFTSEEALEGSGIEPGDGSGETGGITVHKRKVTFVDGVENTVDTVIEAVNGEAVAKPADPKRDGYVFGGWYTDKELKNVFDFATPIKADTTLYAKWDRETTPPVVVKPSYDVEFAQPDNAVVEVSPASAKEGQKVTVTVTPDAGFELVSLVVADEDGNALELTENADGTYSFEMPAGDVTVHASFACDGGELCPSHGFSDVDTDEWYHFAIDWAVESGVLHGIGGTDRMEPDGKITRAQMAQVLYNVEGAEAGDSALLSGYSDADANAWYAGALSWAVEEGIFSGWQDGGASYIDPEGALTREQAAAVLMRWTEANGGDVSGRADLSDYPDAESVSEWATESMRWAVSAGVLSGVSQPDGTLLLDGQGTATRAQTAQLMMRLLAEQA
jgi:uncharacterized repeat protein (TIGR02543 family)